MGALTSEFARAEHSPGLMLWRVNNRWQAAQRSALRPFGMTHMQFVLLALLADRSADDGPLTQRELADRAATDPMMTSQVLRELERNGLVERKPHPTDARARSLTATHSGRERVNLAVLAVEATDRHFFGALGAETGTLLALLTTLADDVPRPPIDATQA